MGMPLFSLRYPVAVIGERPCVALVVRCVSSERSVWAKFLIDTGANLSMVSKTLSSSWQHVGTQIVSGSVGESEECRVFDALCSLDGTNVSLSIRLAESHLSGMDGVLGVDFLRLCTFNYNGPGGYFDLIGPDEDLRNPATVTYDLKSTDTALGNAP
jgi:predicted aspartyl protease